MNEHPIQGLMKTAMESLKEMVEVNTIVGEAVETPDGSVILPVSRVAFGFGAGGGEYHAGEARRGQPGEGGGSVTALPFGGGAGAGVGISPVGMLVVGPDAVRFLPVDGRAIYDRLLDLVPQVATELRSLFAPGAGGGRGTRETGADGGRAGGRTEGGPGEPRPGVLTPDGVEVRTAGMDAGADGGA